MTRTAANGPAVGTLSPLYGLRVIRDAKMVIDSGERSWARVRSHGRAIRRLKRGFRQNIDIVWIPNPEVLMTRDMVIGHPATVQALMRKIEEAA